MHILRSTTRLQKHSDTSLTVQKKKARTADNRPQASALIIVVGAPLGDCAPVLDVDCDQLRRGSVRVFFESLPPDFEARLPVPRIQKEMTRVVWPRVRVE